MENIYRAYVEVYIESDLITVYMISRHLVVALDKTDLEY